ncbi:MAG: class I SAM-dependent methyltransferase [Cenarchaeum sp. SB0678_bin_8]|nr:class I SAM-dependent methyltransferase [Cenarchaeum sp. SB0666_bin_15]MYD58162.1 class I SAM-dependent methyltransferase [Cenarchaeum sp. SB0678_bin_8]MYJ28262.1 class I SAM-dependent methyltransferase [Cenarchaeum sp. SB0672_bin_9]
MMYDVLYWDDYASGNGSRYSEEFATTISDVLYELHCSSVLEVGCGTGIDLLRMNQSVLVCGVDLNKNALHTAKKINPLGNFQRCTVTQLPYANSSIDFVFSHGLLSCLDDITLVAAMSEMHRVARRYLMDCEILGHDGDIIDGPFCHRDMQARWQHYDIQLIRTRTVEPGAYLVPCVMQLYRLRK